MVVEIFVSLPGSAVEPVARLPELRWQLEVFRNAQQGLRGSKTEYEKRVGSPAIAFVRFRQESFIVSFLIVALRRGGVLIAVWAKFASRVVLDPGRAANTPRLSSATLI